MIQKTDYVPVLKWKMGEYQALYNLNEDLKNRVCPLIEITPIGFDFEKNKDRQTMEEHISDIGTRLKKKWGERKALVDVYSMEIKSDKSNWIKKVFEKYRDAKCNVIPVINLVEEDAIDVFKEIIDLDGKGVAIRIKSKYLDGSELRMPLREKINDLIVALNIGKADVDIIIDFERVSLIASDRTTFDTMQKLMCDNIPEINIWRSFIVLGSSFPEELEYTNENANCSHRRLEWLFYKDCMLKFKDFFRLPTFSDYTIGIVDHKQLDMRLIKPSAKLKYTLADNWYYDKGKAVRGLNSRGFGQFRSLCGSLVGTNYFRGENFSEGDKYIKKCSEGKEGTGNLSTWVWVSTNQHMAKVLFDIANLYVASK